MGMTNNESVLRALRVPHELDKAITEEMEASNRKRSPVMLEWLEQGRGTNTPEVDWQAFDRQVQIAHRVTPSIARALRAAREKLGYR
jgi:hypothetical protein